MGDINIRKPVLIAAALIAVVIISLSVISSTKATHINITGLSVYTEEEFLKEAGLTGLLHNTYLLYGKYKLKGVNKIPYVDTYSVKIADRNTLEIRVYESTAIGCVLVMENYFLFDKNGRVVGSAVNKPDDIPLITGLEFTEIMMFKDLHVQKSGMFSTILEILKLLEKYDIKANELNFDSWNEVTVYTENLTVLLGYRDKYDMPISALAGIYSEAVKIGGTVDLKNYSEDNRDIILR